MTLDELTKAFHAKFGATSGSTEANESGALHAFYAPGRVNLIGDHTDYIGGLVFPCAVDSGNTLLIRRTSDVRVKLASINFELLATLEPEQLGQKYGDQWINYPLAVLDQFAKRGIDITGVECLYYGDVPNGAGLSSSAAIEVVTAFALNQLFDLKLDLVTLVKMSQAAENDFVGVACGIMDQYAVAMASAGHAMQLDCQSLECQQVPLALDAHCFVLANTNQRRELSESNYNTRVDECAKALALLQQRFPVQQLAELSPTQLGDAADVFNEEPVLLKRARHVIEENDRVKRAVAALKAQQLPKFGQLMTESHESLRDDYEVSSEPLEQLIHAAMNCKGVLGTRLTGAGFGGCTVSLVQTDEVDKFMTEVGKQYQAKTGLTADFYRFEPTDGVRELAL